VTPDEIRALADECGLLWEVVPLVAIDTFARRLIAIGRAEAYEESAEDVLKYKRKHGWPEQWAQWLRARAAEERERAKS